MGRETVFDPCALFDLQALNLSGLEGRYSMALYKAASSRDALVKVDADLKGLKKLAETDRGVRDFFKTPVLNVAQKKSGVRLSRGRPLARSTGASSALRS